MHAQQRHEGRHAKRSSAIANGAQCVATWGPRKNFFFQNVPISSQIHSFSLFLWTLGPSFPLKIPAFSIPPPFVLFPYRSLSILSLDIPFSLNHLTRSLTHSITRSLASSLTRSFVRSFTRLSPQSLPFTFLPSFIPSFFHESPRYTPNEP